MSKGKTPTRARTCEKTTRSMPRFHAYPGPTACACGGRTGLDPPRVTLACEDDGSALRMPPKKNHIYIAWTNTEANANGKKRKIADQEYGARCCRTELTPEVAVRLPFQVPSMYATLHAPVATLQITTKHLPSRRPVTTHTQENAAHKEMSVATVEWKGVVLHLNAWRKCA
jgi:hypothetical protein